MLASVHKVLFELAETSSAVQDRLLQARLVQTGTLDPLQLARIFKALPNPSSTFDTP